MLFLDIIKLKKNKNITKNKSMLNYLLNIDDYINLSKIIKDIFLDLIDFKNKIIFLTGGTGSFGKAFVKTLLKFKIKKSIIFSRDESKQWI